MMMMLMMMMMVIMERLGEGGKDVDPRSRTCLGQQDERFIEVVVKGSSEPGQPIVEETDGP